ncbi:MAG: right-handed parallel beta-helix repeat-containing protein [Pirellulaceae bacterium]|nr:right-handed parallel beta-helix repeat-containing protein [Pirellulaceae bacterium]
MHRGPVIEACRLEGIGDDFITIGDISDDDAHSGGIIRGNDFQVGAARGVLTRASNLSIEKNRILNRLEAGISMTECGAIQHVTLRGNHVEDTCFRSISGAGFCPCTTTAAVEMGGRNPATDPLKSDILIEGNTIVRPRGSAVTGTDNKVIATGLYALEQ